MVRRTTWILLIVFGLLVLFAWRFQRFQTNKAENAATVTPQPVGQKLYAMSGTQVVEINITSNSGESIDFQRDPSSSSWVIKGLPAEQANSFQIESVSQQLIDLQVLETLTEAPALDLIGLTNPVYTITMQTSDGKQIVTSVGSLAAIGTGYYLRVDSGPIVLVDNVTMDDVLKLLKEPPVLATSTPEVIATGTGTPIAPTAQPTSTP
jgi:hypothetical protein